MYTLIMVCPHPRHVNNQRLTIPVGGEILDMALSRAKPHARFVMCGAISEYNKGKPQGPKVRSAFFSLWHLD